MSILDVEKVMHSYGDKVIFKGISFRLMAGEHVGLVGANGAGKSTLFRLLTGDATFDSGSIKWMNGVKRGHLEQHIEYKKNETLREYLLSSFQELLQMEKEMILVTEKMAEVEGDELEHLLKKFTLLQESLERGDFYLIDAKVEEIAAGLGITDIGLDRSVEQLSGGQRTKLLLAKLLLEKPQVLLLDEPTNYLDTEHIEWLRGYLKSYPNAFLLISHDVEFMNDVVGLIYHIEHQSMTRYVGNYNQFLAAYELRKDQVLNAYNRQQKEVEKLQTYISKNKARASTSKMAKSREKQLNKMELLDKPTGPPRPRFKFDVCVQPTSIVMQAERLEVGYTYTLLPPMDLTIKRGEKVALVGYNGIGKSTSLKTILGLVAPRGGEIEFGERVEPAYFEQDDEVGTEKSAFEEIYTHFPHLTQKEIRGKLAYCGLKSEHIMQPLKTLSGGEWSKVRLCKLMLMDSNWLVLDEPTNHLDVFAKEALQNALIEYKGTVLIVSHEPSFYEGWVDKVWNVESWLTK